jgi:uncharacterized tellurite resistance protein B-like protein
MKAYGRNSPEAIARVLAMMMITDARLDDREIEIMDELRIFDIVGISRSGFSQVVKDYCDELLASGSKDGRVKLVDKARIDDVIAAVDDPQKRVQTAGMILNIANADGNIHETELAVFRYVLERWGMTLESLERDLARH